MTIIFVVFGVFCVIRAQSTKKAPFGVKEAFTRMYIYKERVYVRTCARYSAFGALGASALGALGASAFGASGAGAAAGASLTGASRNSPVVN